MVAEVTDEEIAAGFRPWLQLPADASPEQMWAARPSRVAVHRLLRAQPDPIEFIRELLTSARDSHELALVCETVTDVVKDRHPETVHSIFARSDAEPWATLSRYVFGGAPEQPSLNAAQAAEVYAWMGGERSPDEGRSTSRYNDAAFSKISDDIRNPELDPIPLLALLVRAARTDDELGFIGAGPFEDAIRYRPEHREAILAVARAVPEWIPVLEDLS